MWPICQGKGQSLYWRVKIKRVVLLSETLHKKASILCPYLQKYLILKSNTIISSKMLKAFTCQKNTAVLPFLNWLSIIPTMLAVWLAGWNVHLVSKYHLNVLSMPFQFHEKKWISTDFRFLEVSSVFCASLNCDYENSLSKSKKFVKTTWVSFL